MYKILIKSIRPDVTVEFFRYDSDFYDYIKERFVDSGSLISYQVSLSDDKQVEFCDMKFDSKQEFYEFIKDPVISYQEPYKVRYNLYNKIAVSMNTENIEISKDLYNIYLR